MPSNGDDTAESAGDRPVDTEAQPAEGDDSDGQAEPTDESRASDAPLDSEPDRESPGPVSYARQSSPQQATGNSIETEPEPDEGPPEGESTAEPGVIENVETVVVDPDDVVEAMAHNGASDEGLERKAVFSLAPPFDDTVELSVRYIEDDYSKEIGDGQRHVRPFRFVDDGRAVLDQRPTPVRAREQLGEDADEAAVRAWIDEAIEEWERYIRANLVDEIDVYSSHGITFHEVSYTDD